MYLKIRFQVSQLMLRVSENMGSRKRHHYIPKFLLARFSSDGGTRLWQMAKDAEIEVGIRDVAVSKYFYGEPETGVEDAFAEMESEFGAALGRLDRGHSPEGEAKVLRSFVWLLNFRTRALRSAFQDVFSRGLEEIANPSNEEAARNLILSRMETQLEELMEELGLSQLLQNPELRSALLERAKDELNATSISSMIKGLLEESQLGTQAGHLVARAHVEALSRAVKGAFHVPETFAPQSWRVVAGPAHSVVLGDCCVFATTPDGTTTSLLRSSPNWEDVYLPVSSCSVVVGSRRHDSKPLSIQEINRASVELSERYVFASKISHDLQFLASKIGSRAAVFTEEELAKMVAEVFAESAGDR